MAAGGGELDCSSRRRCTKQASLPPPLRPSVRVVQHPAASSQQCGPNSWSSRLLCQFEIGTASGATSRVPGSLPQTAHRSEWRCPVRSKAELSTGLQDTQSSRRAILSSATSSRNEISTLIPDLTHVSPSVEISLRGAKVLNCIALLFWLERAQPKISVTITMKISGYGR